MMTREVFQGLVRHALTVAGGALAARWGWSGEVVDALVGAGAILAGAAWSVIANRRVAGERAERWGD